MRKPTIKKSSEMYKLWIPGAVLVCMLAAGCGDVGDTTPELTAVPPKKIDNPKFPAEAGVGADVDMTPTNMVAEIAKSKHFGIRGDAFAMLASERVFDRAQTSARLVSDGGGFSTYFTEPEEVVDLGPVMEPLPNWRLSGVVIGDGVAALLDMGPGKVIDIHPGMKIPDTEWTVVSIDSERAVLKRSGNRLPHTFIVPLQGVGAGGGGGTGGSGGGAGSGGGDGTRKGGPIGAGG